MLQISLSKFVLFSIKTETKQKEVGMAYFLEVCQPKRVQIAHILKSNDDNRI